MAFRGLISFGPEAPPGGGAFPAQLRYDPNPADADDSTQPVPWCSVFAFDGDGLVTLGTRCPPGDDTWCIADVDIAGGGSQHHRHLAGLRRGRSEVQLAELSRLHTQRVEEGPTLLARSRSSSSSSRRQPSS